ncbi:MAG TPA: condensation domain-containing protein, partial [Longimicrobiaceae bacterium]|nr:condensation domain-containing protein [Longimicrobiaceae bacterium]
VRDAAVVARDGAAGEPRLVAYLAAAGGAPAAAELRAWLGERLPEYMVPSAFVALDALPLTSTGKLDRRALPEPDPAAGDEARVAPRTPTEELLAGIFADVLGAARVGADTDFFAAGGHSLLATRVISRVREATGVELPLRALFEAPTVAALAARVDARMRAGDVAGEPPLAPTPRDDAPLPLSFAQQRLWFLDRMEPGSPAYNMPAALRIRGAVDAGALRRSFAALVERHEALRTTFATLDGEPVQVVHPPAPFPLGEADLRGLGAAEREAELLRRARAEAAAPFDLARGPLLRARLLRLDEAESALLVTMHHVVSDGWSIGLLVHEVSALYQAFAGGDAPRLPELPVQYADFALWQRRRLTGDVLDAQIAFWRERLAGAPPVLELPTDHPRPAVLGARGASVAFALAPAAWDAVRQLARRGGATLFMTLLAGWQALLGRWADAEDVVVGAPVAGRTRREVESLIGFFVNTLALRTDLSGDPTVAGLLGRVRESVLAAHAHQELPFERLVEELGVRRDLAHTPLFQVMFTLDVDAAGGGAPRLGGMETERLEVGTATTKFDLLLAMADEGGRLTGALEFRTDLFEAATGKRMTEQLGVLLEAMAADPERRLSGVEWVAPAERRLLVEGWNRTARDYPRESVHALFAEQAARTPDAVALSFQGGSLTYAELDRRANQLAHHLRRRGVGAEARVGVCMERSPELVAALLGVLKAGGAYVPLDPAYPAARLAYLLADSDVAAVLTQERLRGRLQEGGAEVVAVDAAAEEIARESGEAPAVPTDPDQLAYVIHTSGSTGEPKGAAVPHRAVVRLVRGADYVRFGPGEVFLQLAPTGFDAATFEIWGALLNGARLVLAPAGVPTVPQLAGLLAREGVTTLWLTASLFAVVVDERPEALAGVRQLLAGGDVLPPAHVRRALEALPGTRLVNGYGPTENTTFTCTHAVNVEDAARGGIPIGLP